MISVRCGRASPDGSAKPPDGRVTLQGPAGSRAGDQLAILAGHDAPQLAAAGQFLLRADPVIAVHRHDGRLPADETGRSQAPELGRAGQQVEQRDVIRLHCPAEAPAPGRGRPPAAGGAPSGLVTSRPPGTGVMRWAGLADAAVPTVVSRVVHQLPDAEVEHSVDAHPARRPAQSGRPSPHAGGAPAAVLRPAAGPAGADQ